MSRNSLSWDLQRCSSLAVSIFSLHIFFLAILPIVSIQFSCRSCWSPLSTFQLQTHFLYQLLIILRYSLFCVLLYPFFSIFPYFSPLSHSLSPSPSFHLFLIPFLSLLFPSFSLSQFQLLFIFVRVLLFLSISYPSLFSRFASIFFFIIFRL